MVYECSFDRKTIILYIWDQLQRESHLFKESVLFLPNSCNNFTSISPVCFILLPTCNLCVKKKLYRFIWICYLYNKQLYLLLSKTQTATRHKWTQVTCWPFGHVTCVGQSEVWKPILRQIYILHYTYKYPDYLTDRLSIFS